MSYRMSLMGRQSLSRLRTLSCNTAPRPRWSAPGLSCRGRYALQKSHFSLSTLSLDTVSGYAVSCPEYSFPDADNQDGRPLACSSTLEERRLVQRVVDRIKSWIQKLWDAILVSIRSTEVAFYLSPLVVLSPAAVLSTKLSGSTNPTRLSNLTWWYTLHAIQGLGPAWVKFAQWIATRRDIFPPHFCDRFSKLHDKGYAHSWSHSHAILTQAFGDYEQKGLAVDKNDVIGCGSAAQVYRGTITTSSGTERQVAIKILHPRFQHLVERDLSFFKSVADLLHSLPIEALRMLNLPRVADNFGVILRRQADLTIEAENLTKFRKNFVGKQDEHSIGKILFPAPMEGWIDRDVLVEELIVDAQPIADFLSDSSPQGWVTRQELAGPLLRAFLKMTFIDNYVHCDLHPGNVLVKTSQVPKSSWWSTSDEMETKRTIVFLDAGIATSLSPNDKRNLKDLFRAVILNDGNKAGRLMVERAKYERCSQVEGGIDAFARGVEEIVSEFHDRRKQGLTLGAVRIGSLLSRVLDLCRVHGVEVDPAMANIVISTLVLEGLGRSLDPSLNLIDCAVPFVLGRGAV